MKIEKFEDIKSWQVARELNQMIYVVTKSEPFSGDWELKNQIRSAAGSIMHNIAEGFDSGRRLEFIRFLRFSVRSTSEVQSQLYIALDQKYINDKKFSELYAKCEDIKALIGGFIKYLKTSET